MSTAAPEKIRITDLANPILSELQSGAIAYATANPVNLDSEEVISAAKAATGLSDFGGPDYRERLDVWMRAGNDDVELGPVGRLNLFSEAVRFATNRLQVEDEIKRHPEILDIEIERPLIIAGLPRSGTTYTLQLMSADPKLRSLPYWEAVRPVKSFYMKDGKDTRHELCDAQWVQADAMMPYMKAIHEFAPDHISEDIELQSIDFGGYYYEWLAKVPEWRDYQASHDATSIMCYVRRVMQLLSWQSGPNRWVNKCPQHMEQLLAVRNAFPDSYIVINHRDPVASIQSAITSIAYGARLTRTRVDLKAIADYWIDRYERLLRSCVCDRDQLEPSQSYDLYFHELMADPFGQLEKIYTGAGVAFDQETRDAFHKAIDNNKRGKHGQLSYDLRADFGLEPEAIRERFGFYYSRFPDVRIEVK